MSKKRIGIAGAGNMGCAIAWAMETLGYDLIVTDQSPEAIERCQQLLNNTSHRLICGTSNMGFSSCDAVISSLPYHQNVNLAVFCIRKQIPYFDLGGSVGVSNQINTYATTHATQPVMTDLGLAPGWVNIIADHMFGEYIASEGKVPNTITMMVGGLPQHPNNTLRYTCTWSYDGLINEYRDNCIVLINGHQEIAQGMDGYQFPVGSELGPLEAFYTSGGAAHTIETMRKRGVQNCSYKTLRYPQHRQLVNFLIHESGLDDETIIDIFKRTCPPQEDLVIIKVSTDHLSFEKVIKSDHTLSAMQKATAFPIVAAAHTVLENEFSGPVLRYTDIGPTPFNKALNTLFDAVPKAAI